VGLNRAGGTAKFPSDSRKLVGENGKLLVISGSFSFSELFEEDPSTVIDAVMVRLSTAERWLSPRRRNFSLAALLKEDKFLGRPSLKELDLGLRLP
jgi:hypothetical protein